MQDSEEAELRRQISELRAANARLEARRVDAEKVFEQELQRLGRQEGAHSQHDVEALRRQVARLQAALELSQKSMARSSVEGLRDKDDVIAIKDHLIAELREQLTAAASKTSDAARHDTAGMRGAPAAPLSPDSLGTITLVESDVDGSAKDSGGASSTMEAQSMHTQQGALSGWRERERELEAQLADAAARERKLRVQLGRLEGIHKSAQGTALAQEQQLQQAVHAMGRTSQTLEHTTAGLSMEVEQWRAKADAASKEASKFKGKAEEAAVHLSQYDAALTGLEKELAECKATLQLYHDRIVALAGAEDKVVKGHSRWRQEEEANRGVLPLSSHLKATSKLAQEYAAERRHLERTIAISGKALEAARAELLQCQTLRAQENHQWQLRVREQQGAVQELQHRVHVQRDDGVVRTQELERSVRLLSSKSDAHQALAALSAELTSLRTTEQRLKNDVDFFRERAATAERENKEAMQRVVALQCRLNSAQFSPGGSEQLVTTMSEQIEAQEAELVRLEGLLRVAKAQYDEQTAGSDAMRAGHEEQLQATQLVADAHVSVGVGVGVGVRESALQRQSSACVVRGWVMHAEVASAVLMFKGMRVLPAQMQQLQHGHTGRM